MATLFDPSKYPLAVFLPFTPIHTIYTFLKISGSINTENDSNLHTIISIF